jgi:hypothetical protein
MGLFNKKSRHHRKHKRNDKKIVSEKFIISYIFPIIGIVVIASGLFYMAISLDFLLYLKTLLLNAFKPSVEFSDMAQYKKVNVNLPIIVYGLLTVLTLPLAFVPKKFVSQKLIFSFLSLLYFSIIQIKFLALDGYSPILLAQLYRVVPLIGLLIFANRFKKPSILIFSSIYCYISTLAYVYYVGHLIYQLPLFIALSIYISWSARKLSKPYLLILSFVLSLSIFVLFWLKHFVVNHFVVDIPAFFLFGICFYLLFYCVIIYNSSDKENPLPKWLQSLIGVFNVIIFILTTSFVITKFYSSDLLYLVAIGLTIFNILGLYLTEKYVPSTWKLPNQIITLILLALILPLILNHSIILLFTAFLSILLVLFSKNSKNQPSIIFSVLALGIMFLDYLVHWIFDYIPVLFMHNEIPPSSFVWKGVFSGAIAVFTLLFVNYLLKEIKITYPTSIFNRNLIRRVIKGLSVFALFLLTGWVITISLCTITDTMNTVAPAWFISGSLFFCMMVQLKSQSFSPFRKSILLLSFVLIFMYLPLVHLNFIGGINNLVSFGIYSFSAIWIHYIALGLFIVLTSVTIVHLFEMTAFKRDKSLQRGLQTLSLIILFFILFSEYDNLALLSRTDEFIHKPSVNFAQEITGYGRRLPYSIILLSTSLVVFVLALFRHMIYLRILSIILFFGAIVKMFLYDFSILGNTGRIVLFFVSGFLLIGFSFIYPKLRKVARPASAVQHRGHRHHSHDGKQEDLKI